MPYTASSIFGRLSDGRFLVQSFRRRTDSRVLCSAGMIHILTATNRQTCSERASAKTGDPHSSVLPLSRRLETSVLDWNSLVRDTDYLSKWIEIRKHRGVTR